MPFIKKVWCDLWGRLSVVVLALLLSGCAAQSPDLNEIAGASGSAVAGKNHKGIAILKVSYTPSCPHGVLTIGKREANGFVEVTKKGTAKNWIRRIETVQFALEAGQYHVVNYECVSGRYQIRVGRHVSGGSIFTGKAVYGKSKARCALEKILAKEKKKSISPKCKKFL